MDARNIFSARRRRLLECTVLLVACCGCQDLRWCSDPQQAEEQARQQNRYLFVFYKYWLDSDSGRMFTADGLSSPRVTRLLQDTVNVLIDQDYGPSYRNYVSKYGVNSYPAVIVVAPDGTYQARTGYLPQDRLIEFLEAAKSPHPPRPASGRSAYAAP